jgi:glycosyltransferase involved in cell wall biosynthesis
VSRLLGDASLRERLARCAYERAIERFHPLVIAKRHLEIYREVLSGKEEAA